MQLSATESSFSRLPGRECVQNILKKTVLAPAQDILSRPCKEVRAQLTQLGFSLSNEHGEKAPSESEQNAITACGELIEILHAGSLVVDDIQDNSEIRRGHPTLHLRYGLPLALNAGNWMYFYAFEPLKQLTLDDHKMLLIYQATQETLLSAHYGQALDLSTRIDEKSPEEMNEISFASLELKTGALMALAIELGAIIGGATTERKQMLRHFGVQLGVSLQMFDDIGNLKPERPTPKHLEDLVNRRPSFVWAFLSQKEFQHLLPQFKTALQSLPDTQSLTSFLQKEDLTQKMWNQSWNYFLDIQNELKKNLSESSKERNHVDQFSNSLQLIFKLGERIAHAYS